VREWCLDWNEYSHPGGSVLDPTGGRGLRMVLQDDSRQ